MVLAAPRGTAAKPSYAGSEDVTCFPKPSPRRSEAPPARVREAHTGGGWRTVPVELTIDVSRRRVDGVARGPLTAADLKAGFLNMLAHPDYQPGMSALLDLTEGHLSEALTIEELHAHVDLIATHQSHRGRNSRSAFVAPGDLDYGMLRTLEAIADDLPMEIMVFRFREEAEKWLSEDGLI